LFHRVHPEPRNLGMPCATPRSWLRATPEARPLKKRDGFHTLSNDGCRRWRSGPSRNSIEVAFRLMCSPFVIASIEPRSSITSKPKRCRDDALSENFVTIKSPRPPNSMQADCRSRESLRYSTCMKQPSPESSGQLMCRSDPDGLDKVTMNATLPVLNRNRQARFVIPGINLDAFNFTIRWVNRAASLCQPHGHFTTFSLLEILVEPFRRDGLLMSQSSIKGSSDMSGVQEPRPDERRKQIANRCAVPTADGGRERRSGTTNSVKL
jgi:hypothetical protein